MSKRIIIAALLAAVAMPAGAQTVTATGGVNTLTGQAGGVRFRNFDSSADNGEQYLGVADLGTGANRVEQSFTWGGSNTFTFTYDAGLNALTSQVNGNTVLNYANFTSNPNVGPADEPFNQISFFVRDDNLPGGVSLSNLRLDGNLVGTGTFAGVSNIANWWAITGSNFTDGFSLTGTINLTGPFQASPEAARIEFLVGNNAAIPEPATWAMMIGGFGLVGAAMRRRERTTLVTA